MAFWQPSRLMLASSAKRILDTISDDARVLDVGGWGQPFARADDVIDLQPYDTRGDYGVDRAAELGERQRFSEATWVVRDICDREPWPFADREFDFVICSQTLEDVRDPVAVCDEMTRVARAGYVEVPSRLEEQTWAIVGPLVGWSTHRWLCDVSERSIEFVFKPHIIHARASDSFPTGFCDGLSAEQRVGQLWWEGGFDYRERVLLSAPEVDAYLADFVAENRHLMPDAPPRSIITRLLRR
jgi:hypothetical protein